MKSIYVMLLSFLFVFAIGKTDSFGQTEEEDKTAKEEKKTSKEEKKAEKEEKKRLKEEAALADWNESKDLAENQRWVFESNQAFTNDGSFGLDPKTNFLYVIDEEAVIQFALDGVIVKGNGVGGITIQGMVMDYKVFADKENKPVRVDMKIKPKAGQGIGVGLISVTFFGEGYGEVQMNTQGFRLNGNIYTPEKSNIYQGTAF